MRQNRRQLLCRGLGLLPTLGVATLLGCKQPVAPEGRASVPARSSRLIAVVPTPTRGIDRPHRVGMLGAGHLGWQCDRIREALRKRGYIVDWRQEFLPGADTSQLRALARNLLARDVELIVALEATSAFAASQETQRVPIVMALGAYPVEIGLVMDLARPGGNVTGVLVEGDALVVQRLALLREMQPALARLAVLTNPAGPISALAWRDTQSAAVTAGIQAHEIQATSVAQLGAAFTAAANAGAEAVLVSDDELFENARQSIVFQAEHRKMAVVYGRREFVEEGGLISFGPEIEHAGQLAGSLADRILQGTHPGSLPFEVADRLETTINLNAAAALGLTFPASISGQATHVVPVWP